MYSTPQVLFAASNPWLSCLHRVIGRVAQALAEQELQNTRDWAEVVQALDPEAAQVSGV